MHSIRKKNYKIENWKKENKPLNICHEGKPEKLQKMELKSEALLTQRHIKIYKA